MKTFEIFFLTIFENESKIINLGQMNAKEM